MGKFFDQVCRIDFAMTSAEAANERFAETGQAIHRMTCLWYLSDAQAAIANLANDVANPAFAVARAAEIATNGIRPKTEDCRDPSILRRHIGNVPQSTIRDLLSAIVDDLFVHYDPKTGRMIVDLHDWIGRRDITQSVARIRDFIDSAYGTD